MGGFISVAIAAVATAMLFLNGSPVWGTLAILNGTLSLGSWLLMNHHARMLARQRLYVEACERGDIEDGSAEAARYWREMPITLVHRDIVDTPNWIAACNLFATVGTAILLIVALIKVIT
jgi:hypothetical protein